MNFFLFQTTQTIKPNQKMMDNSSFSRNELFCKLLRKEAKAPTRAHEGDAGYDLFLSLFPTTQENEKLQEHEQHKAPNKRTQFEIKDEKSLVTIPPGGWARLPTGIALTCPKYIVWQIWARSGWAFKSGCTMLGGIVDSGYRDEVYVVVYNLSAQDLVIENGSRIAQLVPVQLSIHMPKSLPVVESLPPSERNKRGFGSSGK